MFVCVCVGYVLGPKHCEARGRLKMFVNLKSIFAPFVLFYYLQNYLTYKTLLFTIHSVVFINIPSDPCGISAYGYFILLRIYYLQILPFEF